MPQAAVTRQEADSRLTAFLAATTGLAVRSLYPVRNGRSVSPLLAETWTASDDAAERGCSSIGGTLSEAARITVWKRNAPEPPA